MISVGERVREICWRQVTLSGQYVCIDIYLYTKCGMPFPGVISWKKAKRGIGLYTHIHIYIRVIDFGS